MQHQGMVRRSLPMSYITATGTSGLHSENDATFPSEFSFSQRGPFFGPLFYVDFCYSSSVAADH